MSDVDFSQVKGVRVPQGEVKYIENEARTKCLWKRPFTYPIAAIYFYSLIKTSSGETVRVEVTPKIYSDKYGTTKVLEDDWDSSYTATDGQLTLRRRSFAGLEIPGENVDESYRNNYISPLSWVRNNACYVVGCSIANEEALSNLGRKTPALSNCAWTVSNTLRMYASPTGPTGQWASYKLGTSGYACKEQIYEPITHETDITITHKPKLFTLKRMTTASSSWQCIQDITSNFDTYRTMYETATSGKYPKSTYPYLVGHVYLESTGCLYTFKYRGDLRWRSCI